MKGDVPNRLGQVIEAFRMIPDRSERIEILIDFADRFREVPASVAQRPFPEENRVPHCESEAFVFVESLPEGRLKLHFAVENPQGLSARAVAVILDETLSGAKAEEIAAVDPSFVYDIFGHELSTGKGLGLTGIVSMVQQAARKYAEIAAQMNQ